ncbi:WD repeat-containing protein 44 isoform X2 [Contarinia nasturtii]|uniref:WD repeat-containing protein 44 isoform X2 n=1 Tax=Contarinia nasturtii TaxID=265458 RepID=UPI0012D400CE|nr:WD repeat-containing protein 44 isoform X2 [Contarinia nasturtii]
MQASIDSDDSEEYYDAEDSTPNRLMKKRSPNSEDDGFVYPDTNVEKPSDKCDLDSLTRQKQQGQKATTSSVPNTQPHVFAEPKPNSSVEGVFAPQRSTHPFRIIENSDTISIQSMTSLGRVGRILAGTVDVINSNTEKDTCSTNASSIVDWNAASTSNTASTTMVTDVFNDHRKLKSTANNSSSSSSSNMNNSSTSSNDNTNINTTLQEPDVIASTKLAHSKTTDSLTSSGPIAPPRRKKKPVKTISTNSVEQMSSCTESSPSSTESKLKLSVALPPASSECAVSLPSPATKAIETLTREIENSFVISSDCNSREMCGSMSRICQSLGNSSTSVYSKPSPSNSSKSNSAPGRASSIDPNQGLNLYKATRGQYVVKPQDEEANKAEGPSKEELERIEKIRAEIFGTNSTAQRPHLSATGSNSLGNGMRYGNNLAKAAQLAKERRKSAGDEDVLKQLNVFVRTRTDSGKKLTDFEILEQVPVKNLDTGEKIPLSEVKPPPPPDGWNPLSLHIHKLTSHLEALQKESDEESVIGVPPGAETPAMDEDEVENEESGRIKRKTARLKRFFGSTMRKTVDRAKLIASEVSHARHKEDVADIVDVVNPEQNIKIKASSTNKGPYEFAKLQHVQDLSGEHTGAVWCMKFSSCGRLLATAGQDRVLRIWVLKDAYPYFQDMRTKYNADQKSSPTPSQESLVSHNSAEEAVAMATAAEQSAGPFMPKAFCSYTGHTSDLLDVSWSKNYFILSSSMDKTVRLWHISRRECLCCFQHIDFVTAIAFHPRDDRYFLSGSLDGKLRLWNIPDKKVTLWNELDGQTKLITAANFCQNGKFAVVGSYDGRCLFYDTDQNLKYHTQIHVRSTRGRNKTGRKISGIEPMPGEDKILVTSNDSRVRLYDLRDLNLSCKYKGYLNTSSQIKASFSHDGKYIIAGSENQCIYVWKTNHDYKLSSVRRDRSDFWEGIKAHNATVTCAIFTPHPEAIIKPEIDDDDISSVNSSNIAQDPMVEQRKKGCGYVLISADFNGAIKVFVNKTKPKHSSLPYTAILD